MKTTQPGKYRTGLLFSPTQSGRADSTVAFHEGRLQRGFVTSVPATVRTSTVAGDSKTRTTPRQIRDFCRRLTASGAFRGGWGRVLPLLQGKAEGASHGSPLLELEVAPPSGR